MQNKLKSTGLAVVSACLLTALANAQGSITTTFASNNGGGVNWGNFFDVDVKNPLGLKITSIDVNNTTGSGTVTIDVYITPKTYVGNDLNSAVWSKVATGTGPSKARNTATPINTNDFFLAPGKYGMFVHFTAGSPAYTNGTGSNQTYSNKDIALALGIARTLPFGGSLFTPRVWNGTIHYDADDKAAHGGHGYACPGSNNKSPRLSLSADPVIGTTVKLNVTDMINQTTGGGRVFMGLKQVVTDLTPIGMPKCALFNDALLTLGFANLRGSASMTLVIPNNKALIGGILHLQAANPDKAANTLGVAASNGLSVRLGNK